MPSSYGERQGGIKSPKKNSDVLDFYQNGINNIEIFQNHLKNFALFSDSSRVDSLTKAVRVELDHDLYECADGGHGGRPHRPRSLDL